MFELNFGLEILAFITGVIFYRRITPVVYKLLIPFLGITCLNEGLTYYGFYLAMGWNKDVFFNFYFLLEFLVIGTIYLVCIRIGRVHKILLFLFVFSLISLLVLLVKVRASSLDPDYISIICVFIIFMSVSYIYHVYQSGRIIELKSDPVFWFSVGSIVAQVITVFFVNARRVSGFDDDSSTTYLFGLLNTAQNIIYYSCISYSFLCTYIYRKRVGT